jgi:hypothetical protein
VKHICIHFFFDMPQFMPTMGLVMSTVFGSLSTICNEYERPSIRSKNTITELEIWWRVVYVISINSNKLPKILYYTWCAFLFDLAKNTRCDLSRSTWLLIRRVSLSARSMYWPRSLALRYEARTNSCMKFLHMYITGLRGNHNPAIANIKTTVEVAKWGPPLKCYIATCWPMRWSLSNLGLVPHYKPCWLLPEIWWYTGENF